VFPLFSIDLEERERERERERGLKGMSNGSVSKHDCAGVLRSSVRYHTPVRGGSAS
jgi:hypothetical protein